MCSSDLQNDWIFDANRSTFANKKQEKSLEGKEGSQSYDERWDSKLGDEITNHSAKCDTYDDAQWKCNKPRLIMFGNQDYQNRATNA